MHNPTYHDFEQMTKDDLLAHYVQTMEEVAERYAEYEDLFKTGTRALQELRDSNAALRDRVAQLEAENPEDYDKIKRQRDNLKKVVQQQKEVIREANYKRMTEYRRSF